VEKKPYMVALLAEARKEARKKAKLNNQR